MKIIECNRLIYNPEYEKVQEKWSNLGLDVPASESVEKYTKLLFGLNCDLSFMWTQDDENDDWSVIIMEDSSYLLDIHYDTIRNKILEKVQE